MSLSIKAWPSAFFWAVLLCFACPLRAQWEDAGREMTLGNPKKSIKERMRAKERERTGRSGRTVKRPSSPRFSGSNFLGGKSATKFRRAKDDERRAKKVRRHRKRITNRKNPQLFKNPRNYKKRGAVRRVDRVPKHKGRRKEGKYVGHGKIRSPRKMQRFRAKRDKSYSRLHRKIRKRRNIKPKKRERAKRRLNGVKKSPNPLTRAPMTTPTLIVYGLFPPKTSRSGMRVPKGQRGRMPEPLHQKSEWRRAVMAVRSLDRGHQVPEGQREKPPKLRYDRGERDIWYY